MGGIKSKIFSDASENSPEMETHYFSAESVKQTASFEKSKLFQTNATKNSSDDSTTTNPHSNNFDFYFVGDDEQTCTTTTKISPIRGASSFSAPKTAFVKPSKEVIPNLTEEEYNQIQQKKLRDHSLFDTKPESNKGTKLFLR